MWRHLRSERKCISQTCTFKCTVKESDLRQSLIRIETEKLTLHKQHESNKMWSNEERMK